MALRLNDRSQELIRQKVEDGPYRDADEVVDEAIRLLDERDRRLDELRAELQIGVDQWKRGELIDYTPELLEEMGQRAEENARLGKPVRDAVKP